MAILDIILLLLLIPGIYNGLSKGFVRQIIGLVAIILSIWAGFHFHTQLSELLQPHLTLQPGVLDIVSFCMIFLVVLMAASLVGLIVTKVVGMASLGWCNRLIGVIFGILNSALVLGLLILLVEWLNGLLHFYTPESVAGCSVFQALKSFSLTIFPFLKNIVTQGLDSVGGMINA